MRPPEHLAGHAPEKEPCRVCLFGERCEVIGPTDAPNGDEGIGNPDPPFGPGPDDEGIGNVRDDDPDRDRTRDLQPGVEMGNDEDEGSDIGFQPG